MTLAELKRRTSPPPATGFSGFWRAIEWQPDVFKPQKFVVGVCIETSETRATKLMEKPNRLECFFRPAAIGREFSWLMAQAKRSLARGDQALSPNISLSDGLFIQGETIEQKLSDLFDEYVLAAAPLNETGRAETVGPDTDDVRKTVSAALKRIMGLQYEQIARENGETLDMHHLDVTLAPTHGAASVISACYRSRSTIETHLLRTANDINAYASACHRQKKAMFIQMPDLQAPLSAKERSDIERLTGEESWKLECAGFTVPRHDAANLLARDIKEWATPLL